MNPKVTPLMAFHHREQYIQLTTMLPVHQLVILQSKPTSIPSFESIWCSFERYPLYKVLDHVLEVAQSLNLSRKYAYSPSVSPVCRTVIAFLQPGTNQKTMIQNVFKWPPNCKEYKTTCFLHTTVPHKSQISCCINFAGWCFSLFLTFTIKFMIQTMNSSRQKFGTNVKKKLLNTKCKTTLNSNKIHSFKQMITCYENQILCW